MADRIVRPDTAFPLEAGGRKKRPRRQDGGHLGFIRLLPCLICHGPSEAAHVRYSELRYGKRQTGKGERPDDVWCVPLCRDDHVKQHAMNERLWWKNHGVDPLRVAAALYCISGDEDAGKQIIYGAKG